MKSYFDRLTQAVKPHVLKSLKGTGHGGAIGLSLAGTIGLLGIIGGSIAPAVQAQIPITALNAPYSSGIFKPVPTNVATPANSSTFNGASSSGSPTTLNFGSGTKNDRYIQTFTAGGKIFNFGGLVSDIYIRRNLTITDVASALNPKPLFDANRQLGFFERDGTTNLNDIASSYVPDMKSILLSQTINRGTDNLFANQGNGSGNNNNIERIDFVTASGLKAPSVAAQLSNIGFLVLERGAKGAHDTVKVAPILAIDGNGTPTSYGSVVTVSTNGGASGWGSSGINLDYMVMRKATGTSEWMPSDVGSQEIGGIYFSLASLGITTNQTIYGYSILPGDAPTTNILDWTTYPSTSNDTSGAGGIDLMAGGGVFVTHTVTGTVFSDPNGTQVQDLPSEGVVSAGLNAVLLDSAGKVLQFKSVLADGTYTFTGVATPPIGSPYTILITTATPSIGSLAPAITLPTGYVSTGENKKNTPDGTTDTKITITASDFTPIAGQPSAGQPLLTESVKNNFGLEKPPTAITSTTPSQPNPSGTISVAVPITLFNPSTDPDGTVDKYRITVFPSNATSIEIDGVVYTAAGGNGTTAFPTTTGVTVSATKLNTIKVDPIDGAVDVKIPFNAIDNAGKESTNTENAIVPFTVAVAGNKPELILLKRITRINNTTVGKALNGTTIDLTQVVAQPDNPATSRDESGDATNPGWPTNYPKGAIDAGVIKSGDLVEYTIYFLSIGGKPVTNANFCDWVPKNTTFVPDSYGIGKGIQLAIGLIVTALTNVPDYNPTAVTPFLASIDRGVFYNPGAIPPTTYPDNTAYKLNCMTPMGVDGAIVVNLVNDNLTAPNNQLPNTTASGTPGNSYGFVRFMSKVK